MSGRWSKKNRRGRRYYSGIFLVLVISLFLFCTSKDFFTQINLYNLILQTTTLGITALGLTFIMIVGEYDLSPGAVLALSSVISSSLAAIHGWNPVLCAFLAVGIGWACGAINGGLVSRLGLTSFITTLAAMKIFRGIVLKYSSGVTVYAMDDAYRFLGNGVIGENIPVVVVLMICLYLGAWFFLTRTRYGYELYAVGADSEAAALSGIQVKRVRWMAYMLGGVLYGIAGLTMAGRVGAAIPTAGNGMELTAMAAVFIGGCSVRGGTGSPWGTFLGVLAMTLLDNGAVLLNLSGFWIEIIQGCIILIALLVEILRQRMFARQA